MRKGAERKIRRARAVLLLAAASFLLGGCLAPPPPDDPRGWDHARLCGSVPASGYCMIPDN